MSWEASAWAMKKGKDYELEPVTRFVMLTLANYADKEGNDIFPSLRTLEGDTGLSERTIRRHIKHLIACGLMDYGDQSVVSNNPRYRGDKLPKVYRFIFERPGAERGLDLSGFGADPDGVPSKPRPDRESGRTESPERPDRESGAAGQTGGQRVHQTYNPPKEPFKEPEAAPVPAAVPVPRTEPTAEEIEAGRRLREQIRQRNSQRGTFANRPMTMGEGS